MDRKEALKLLRGGPEGIRRFNQTRPKSLPNLSKAHLSEAKLFNADLSEADLRGAKLRRTELYRADLRGANLTGADLRGAKLSVANLRRAQLKQADLRTTLLRWADLRGAGLNEAKLDHADLTGANLIWSDLDRAQLNDTILSQADLRWARFGNTRVACRLNETKGLNEAKHYGPSCVSAKTLLEFEDEIPETFLRGCGLTRRQIEIARSDHGDLAQIELGDPFIGGVFLSYGPQDASFVAKLEKRLLEIGIPVWCDEHKESDDSQKSPVLDAARSIDVVCAVLSRHTVHSDWIKALIRSQKTGSSADAQENPVNISLIRLDDAWGATHQEGGEIVATNGESDHSLLNFTQWQNDSAFNAAFEVLLHQLRTNTQPTDTVQEPLQ